MSQKIAFITGGNRGLGFQTALELKDAGVKVVIGSRDLAQGEQAVARLRAAGCRRRTCFTSTSPNQQTTRPPTTTSTRAMAGSTFSSTTPASPRALFPATAPEHSVSGVAPDLLHKIFETNFFAQVALTRALLPLLKKSPAGRIVNLSSILASLTLHAIPRRPSTTPNPSPTTPPKPRSTPSPSTWPMSCATPKSRSTPRIPAGSKPAWAARMPPWS